MRYNKPPISIREQIDILKSRGLRFDDEKKAESYLTNISYYRLRAYTYPFQNNADENHPFCIEGVGFEDIIRLYVFDRKLRLLLLDAIEKVEISMRTRIIYLWSTSTKSSHWHLDPSWFNNKSEHQKLVDRLKIEVNRSNEEFIRHYKDKYTVPQEPPCWMSLEVSSFGLLSKFFTSLKRDDNKKEIAAYYGLSDYTIVENWLHVFSVIRNICAHHGRIWNRRISAHIRLPRKPKRQFVSLNGMIKYKIYSSIACLAYVLDTINPGNSFKHNLLELMDSRTPLLEKEMGFPRNWRKEEFWKL